MLKVLLFTNLFPTPEDPTRGVYNLNNFGALSRFCDLRLVCPLPWWTRRNRPHDWLHVQRETFGGIPAYYPSFLSVPGVPELHARGMYASLHAFMNRLHGDFAFDVILAAWAYPDAVAAAQFSCEFGCPLVSMLLGSDINEIARRPTLRNQIRSALRHSRRVVSVSGALKEKTVEMGVEPERVVVQHNGVDGERFTLRPPEENRLLREKLGLPDDRPIVGYVGNFKPEKGVEVLIEAAGVLRQRGRTDLLFTLVGSGPLEESMRSRVKALGIEEQVRFCGRRPHDEIPMWMNAADVMCLASYREGCPNMVLEALASGKAVVASAVGGVPELIRSARNRGGAGTIPQYSFPTFGTVERIEVRDNGVLFPAGDADALAAGIEAALARSWDPATLRSSVEYLSWNDFGETLYGILLDAVREGRGKSRAAPEETSGSLLHVRAGEAE